MPKKTEKTGEAAKPPAEEETEVKNGDKKEEDKKEGDKKALGLKKKQLEDEDAAVTESPSKKPRMERRRRFRVQDMESVESHESQEGSKEAAAEEDEEDDELGVLPEGVDFREGGGPKPATGSRKSSMEVEVASTVSIPSSEGGNEEGWVQWLNNRS